MTTIHPYLPGSREAQIALRDSIAEALDDTQLYLEQTPHAPNEIRHAEQLIAEAARILAPVLPPATIADQDQLHARLHEHAHEFLASQREPGAR